MKFLEGCDYLIAGAAKIGGIEYFHRLPFTLLAENERITAATCEAAITASKNLQRVVYLSSSMVYECATTWPSAEGDEQHIPPPMSSYGFSKLATEYFARAAWDEFQLPYTIVRPFNCVGVGEDAKMSHVVPDLIRKVLSGADPLPILGSGMQVRHYTYGKDLARGIVTAMTHPSALNQDFNLSSSESTTVDELAQLIWRKINGGRPLHLVSEKPYLHDVQRRIPDTRKAEALLGFRAETSLSDMVDVVIDAIRNEGK
jgi:nucleoside-diphosphate-sugar epimerase